MTGYLPIQFSDGGFNLNKAEAQTLGEKLHELYQQASPFPHTVIDNFLPEEIVKSILDNFLRASVVSEIYFLLITLYIKKLYLSFIASNK